MGASESAPDSSPALSAASANPFLLYERSVQNPDVDIALIELVTKHKFALSLREDFCGTAWLSSQWVRSHPQRTALGVDLDEEALVHNRTHHVLSAEAKERLQLKRQDVFLPCVDRHDVIVAFNFSYCLIHSRKRLIEYFSSVHLHLSKEGVFILDVYGGPDSQLPLVNVEQREGFNYCWEQEPVDAVTGEAKRHISFQFPDGTLLDKAFSYHWRLWSLPELKDILEDAGFSHIEVFWENSTNGQGNGKCRKVEHATNEQAFVAYIAAWKECKQDRDTSPDFVNLAH